MTKIFIATPAFSGKVDVMYAISLSDTCMELCANNINHDLLITTCGSLLVLERNRLIARFLETDCTHILCIDSDIAWSGRTIPNMLKHDVPFVCGLYPSRHNVKDFFFRQHTKNDGSLIINENGLIKVQGAPAGFMLIRREVFVKIMQDNPHLEYVTNEANGERYKGFAFFNAEIIKGEFFGEDYAFCNLVNKSGFDCWVDPCIELDHAGVKGMFLTKVIVSKPIKETI